MLDLSDAAELAEMLTFLADWLTAFVGHPAYNTEAFCADLHGFAFLLASATATNSSASRHHDQQHRRSQRA